MENQNKIQEGLDALDRIKLLMGYDMSKTLTENKIIFEQTDDFSKTIELTIPDKNTYLKSGTKLTWNITNKDPKKVLKIEKVEITPPPKETSKDWNCANSPNCTQKRVYVSSYTEEGIKPGWKGVVNLGIFFGFDDYYSESGAQKYFNFGLTITTSEGQIKTTLRGGEFYMESRVAQKQRQVKEKVIQRKTPNLGVNVPEGFSPFSYDEFITELYDTISNRYSSQGQNCNYQSYYKKYIASDPVLSKKYPQPKNINNSEDNEFCNTRFKSLLEKYYNEKFPTGVTPEDKEEFDKSHSQAKSELDIFKKQHMSTTMRGPQVFDESKLSPELQKKYKELVKNVKSIESEFGYDDRNWFDKFWEEYGIWVQVGVGVLSMIASLGASSPAVALLIAETIGVEAVAVTSALVAAERFSILADFYMNATVGTYQLAKGDTKEAMLSFFFAALPKIHKLYSKIGNLFGTPSVDIAKSLANKIGQVSLRNHVDINAFLATISKEEAIYFKKALKLNKDDWKKIWELVDADMKKSLQIPITQKIVKVAKGTGKFLGTAVLDFSLIATSQELYEASVKQINNYCKNCMTTEEEKRKAKTYLNKLSPNQIKNLESFLNMIQLSEMAESEKGKVMQGAVTGQFVEEIENLNKQTMSSDEILKRVKDHVKNMEKLNK